MKKPVHHLRDSVHVSLTWAGATLFVLSVIALAGFRSTKTADGTGLSIVGPPAPEKEPPIVIVLDPGHGGDDGGTVNRGLVEKDLTIDVVRRVRKILTAAGETVLMTRDGDQTRSLAERIALANGHPRGVYLSVHFNYGEPPAARGIETYYADPKSTVARNWVKRTWGLASDDMRDSRSQRLAECVQREACEATGTRDRGIKNEPTFAVIRDTFGPAALIECGFLSNSREAVSIQDEAYRQRLAAGIAKGLRRYVSEMKDDPKAGVSLGSGTPASP